MRLHLSLLAASMLAVASCGSTPPTESQASVDAVYDLSLPRCERALAALPVEELVDYPWESVVLNLMTEDEALWFLFTDEGILVSPEGNRRAPFLSMEEDFNRLRDAGADSMDVFVVQTETGEWVCDE